MRIGHGYDVHRFAKGRKLMLCGVEVDYELGLLGHSDADAALHALADSILGALALGDIGKLFPDSDPRYKDADSALLLALCVRAVGVLLALAGTRLDWKERLFCVIAYLPKATVQAAIGSVPLAMGLPCGALVLSVAVLAILITAPLGAIGIDSTCRRLLRPAD